LAVALAWSVAACSDGSEPGALTEGDVIAPDGAVTDGDAGVDVAEISLCDAGGACDDGDPCTEGDTLDAECVCAGTPMDCEDGETCTVDVCDDGACVTSFLCDDGDPCTADACDAQGLCSSSPLCDDGLACTKDTCETGVCSAETKNGWCLSGADGGTCVQHYEEDPENSCQLCDAQAPGGPGWVILVDGAPCDDQNACTKDESCELGACVGKYPTYCPPMGTCLEASCDPEEGCIGLPLDGPCNDGNACTVGDVCVEGACLGGADAPTCDDGDVCTLDDYCLDGLCNGGPGVLDCDDGDACTFATCTAQKGCEQESACTDDDPCTDDTCQPDGTCAFLAASGPCEDGDPCTFGETCQGGDCQGGAPDLCDDGNACTADTCVDGQGCANILLNDVACNDGTSCSLSDTCWGGICLGTKQNWCPDCATPVTDHAGKAVLFEISTDGYAGSGINVDDDLTTCAPANKCSEGVDNALGELAFLINGPMGESVNSGNLMYVVELGEATLDGQPFPFSLLDTELSYASELAGCDYQTEVCEYVPSQSNYDAACNPFFHFENATAQDGMVKAGGPGTMITILFALSATVTMPLVIGHARFEGSYETNADGTKITAMNGILGGATPKEQLLATLENVNPGVLLLPIEDVIDLLDVLIENDVDLDGDGLKDAASVGIRVQTIGATLGVN
jgi:hypothetical protein